MSSGNASSLVLSLNVTSTLMALLMQAEHLVNQRISPRDKINADIHSILLVIHSFHNFLSSQVSGGDSYHLQRRHSLREPRSETRSHCFGNQVGEEIIHFYDCDS